MGSRTAICNTLGAIQVLRQQIAGWVGTRGWPNALMFADKVGGWGWPNTDMSKKVREKYSKVHIF